MADRSGTGGRAVRIGITGPRTGLPAGVPMSVFDVGPFVFDCVNREGGIGGVFVEVPGGSGRVPIVDDEAAPREAAAQFLRQAGFTVETAADGVEGTQLFEPDPHGYDLVLLDTVMPRMNGHDTFRRPRAPRPGARVLIASGHSLGQEPRILLEEGALGFVEKWFGRADLARRVVECL